MKPMAVLRSQRQQQWPDDHFPHPRPSSPSASSSWNQIQGPRVGDDWSRALTCEGARKATSSHHQLWRREQDEHQRRKSGSKIFSFTGFLSLSRSLVRSLIPLSLLLPSLSLSPSLHERRRKDDYSDSLRSHASFSSSLCCCRRLSLFLAPRVSPSLADRETSGRVRVREERLPTHQLFTHRLRAPGGCCCLRSMQRISLLFEDPLCSLSLSLAGSTDSSVRQGARHAGWRSLQEKEACAREAREERRTRRDERSFQLEAVM